jgi:hypothetical protein
LLLQEALVELVQKAEQVKILEMIMETRRDLVILQQEETRSHSFSRILTLQ